MTSFLQITLEQVFMAEVSKFPVHTQSFAKFTLYDSNFQDTILQHDICM